MTPTWPWSAACRAFRCRWPLTRPNCFFASTSPSARHRIAMVPGSQRFTLAEWSLQISIIARTSTLGGTHSEVAYRWSYCFLSIYLGFCDIETPTFPPNWRKRPATLVGYVSIRMSRGSPSNRTRHSIWWSLPRPDPYILGSGDVGSGQVETRRTRIAWAGGERADGNRLDGGTRHEPGRGGWVLVEARPANH